MKKRNEILFNIKQNFIIQLIIWVVIVTLFETKLIDNSTIFIFIELLTTLACIIRYFKTKKDNIKKHKFNKDAYKVAYVSTSVLIAIIFIIIIKILSSNDIIGVYHGSQSGLGGFLYGIEYIIMSALTIIHPVIIFILEALSDIFTKFLSDTN